MKGEKPMTYTKNDMSLIRQELEEERRLLQEVSSLRMSWSKLGKMIKLGALLRLRSDWYDECLL